MTEQTKEQTPFVSTSRFYDDMSDRLGLPRVTTEEGWAMFGRKLAPTKLHRFYEWGRAHYGIESTYVEAQDKAESLLGVVEECRRMVADACGLPDPWAAHLYKLEEGYAGTLRVRKPQPYTLSQPAEPKRAPLDWNKSKAVDRFDGYEVKQGCLHHRDYDFTFNHGTERAPSHPTQRIASASAQPDPGHALAAVRQLVR